MMTPALLSAALLLLLLPGAPANSPVSSPFTIHVTNSVTNAPRQTYTAYLNGRGLLLGAMVRLQNSNVGFSFTYNKVLERGTYLVSVNGVSQVMDSPMYWELLVKDGTVLPDVGIGCYSPSANEIIVLNYRTISDWVPTWDQSQRPV